MKNQLNVYKYGSPLPKELGGKD